MTYYNVGIPDGYGRLLRRLTGQPERKASPVASQVRAMPTPERKSPLPEQHITIPPPEGPPAAPAEAPAEAPLPVDLYELRVLLALTGGGQIVIDAVLSGQSAQRAEAEVPPNSSGVPRRPEQPMRPFDIPPTPKVVSDQWVTDDTLGYQAYARAVASLITHKNTIPPLTIGIEAPWGAGKTSVMKMVQHLLDRDACLTEKNEAGKNNRRAESEISFRTLLDKLNKLTDPKADTPIVPGQSPEGEKYGLPGRATVWFNAWKYQTSEQVWAGLAHCIINHVTVRMGAADRELFWLKLNSRRIDVNAVRRKVYESVLHDLLPRAIRWAIVLVLLLLAATAIILIVGSSALRPWFATFLHWVTPATAVVAGLNLWHKWNTAVNAKLEGGDLLKLVREPDYEGKLGFLFLVESDVREVLDLVATPKTPLVIFIDDLDRCVPRKVAEVVEAVSLFLAGDYPNCIFVIGMEPHIVAAALEVANADLIKRLGDLGFGDQSAPMGWRFMEKIVQLPLMLPPPTKSGMSRYLEALAPAKPEMVTNSPPPAPVPSEVQVQQYMQALTAQSTLSDVVVHTERLLTEKQEADVPAIAEASKRVFLRKFDDHDPLVRKFIESAIEVFGANPRQVKRYVNLFRLSCSLRHSIWLDSVQSKTPVELPRDEDITKFVAFSVQWPQATSLLRRTVEGERTDGRAAQSMLALLEQTAAQLDSDPSKADEQWATVIEQCNLGTAPWAKSPQFRRYLATGDALSAAANKGLW